MIESSEEQLDDLDAPTEGSNKPLAWFFIIMILLNPFLAPLLTVLLKANFEPKVTVLDDEIPEEPEVPWDFFEETKDFFQTVDRTLSFPMASAENLPQPSSLHRIFPEFLTGTTKYTQSETDDITTSMEHMSKIVLPFLLKKSDQPKIILVGEAHECVWARKIALLNIAAQAVKRHDLKTIMIHEYIRDPKAMDPYLAQMLENFQVFHTKEYPPKLFELFIRQHCLDYQVAQSDHLIHCFLQAILAYGFELVLANSFLQIEENAQAINAETRHLNGVVGNTEPEKLYPPLKAKQTDKVLIETLQSVLKSATKGAVIWEFVGNTHLKALKTFLDQTTTNPVLVISLAGPSANENYYNNMVSTVRENCVKPLAECPPLPKSREGRGITHCVVGEPFNSKNCDTIFHDAYNYHWETMRFYKNKKVVHTIPPILITKRPKKITDFFAPERAVKFAQKELETKESKKQEFQRVEL